MKTKPSLLLATLAIILFSFTSFNAKNIYAFKVPEINGGTINFSKYKGKKILIVNTALECQYTYQFGALQNLYSTYKDKLVVIGFPSNDFKQEEAENAKINKVCKTRYGVSFPLAAKTNVLGENISPLYKWLCSKKENGVLNASVKWNFNKFLLNEKGQLIAHFSSTVKPDSEEILKHLK